MIKKKKKKSLKRVEEEAVREVTSPWLNTKSWSA